MSSNLPARAVFSIPSIVAIIAAILSFKTAAFFGLVFALVAVIAGLLGLVLSLSPARRGGVLSLVGVFGGLLGIIAAVVKAIHWIVNIG
ncbi:hypothetical protein JIN84_09570 [Luteolibacter yonseiensis]|uniref:Uncharacterized protein n=1 Tax=Luteolibacter yonseiensis TaxID=1144680 RepID=A0A934R400_9BACT|nr:hypothetical protein [Luteolibacter yonseiensis]MBK1815866.1 hypothetical protein [Luteolibacter yonseiensis]